MLNPWVIVAILLAWGGSLLAVGKWQRDDGATAERVAWQGRQTDELQAANAAIKRLQEAARALEAQRVDQMRTIAANYAQGARDAEDLRRRDVAAARDGALVLRIPASACGAGGSPAGAPGAAPAGRDGAARGEFPGEARGGILPPAITADLYAIVDDADQVTRQLGACQKIILGDRAQ